MKRFNDFGFDYFDNNYEKFSNMRCNGAHKTNQRSLSLCRQNRGATDSICNLYKRRQIKVLYSFIMS